MAGEAKLGLIVGVAIVVAAALLWFQPEGAAGKQKSGTKSRSSAISLSPMRPVDRPPATDE